MKTSDPVPEESPALTPGVFSSYGHGWRQMRKFFLELLLVAIVSFLLSIPSLGLYVQEVKEMVSEHIALDFILVQIEGRGAFYLVSLVFLILLEWPIEYGISFVSLKAARGDQVQVKDMFEVFKNYTNAVLANLLVAFITVVGFVFLLVPGIIFACKLAFVSYLVVDRKMDAVAAVKESWRMTSGHAFAIFLMGVLTIFVILAGLLCLGIGIIISGMWIRVAFASLYHAVATTLKGVPPRVTSA